MRAPRRVSPAPATHGSRGPSHLPPAPSQSHAHPTLSPHQPDPTCGLPGRPRHGHGRYAARRGPLTHQACLSWGYICSNTISRQGPDPRPRRRTPLPTPLATPSSAPAACVAPGLVRARRGKHQGWVRVAMCGPEAGSSGPERGRASRWTHHGWGQAVARGAHRPTDACGLAYARSGRARGRGGVALAMQGSRLLMPDALTQPSSRPPHPLTCRS